MKKWSKKGFTLMEIIVVLCIMALLAAIAVPSLTAYWRVAEFRKNESNAKSMYLAAQAALTHYKTSGKLDEYISSVMANGTTGLFADEADSDKNKRIYAITLDKGKYANQPTGADKAVVDLLEQYTYDKSVFDASICLEIDVEAGQVYSVFYASKAPSLTYEAAAGDAVSIQDRSYDARRASLVGYYSVEDLANVVDLRQIRLKVRTLTLQNGEALTLNWSSNSRAQNLDVVYNIDICSKETGMPLFSTQVDLFEQGFQAGADNIILDVTLPPKQEGEEGKKIKCRFPLRYESGQLSLTLDAMMSARLTKRLLDEVDPFKEANGVPLVEYSPLSAMNDFGITRFGIDAQDIYAKVSVQANDKAEQEYTASAVLQSNTANTLFDNGSKKVDNPASYEAGISMFRHISNIRWQDAATTTKFTVQPRSMNWVSPDVLLYDVRQGSAFDGRIEDKGPEKKTQEMQNPATVLAFPTVPELAKTHTLTGESALGAHVIRNLQLRNDSVAPDSQNVPNVPDYKAQYLGLFGENKGVIQSLVFETPSVVVNIEDTKEARAAAQAGKYSANNKAVTLKDLRGVGTVCGFSSGTLEKVSVTSTAAGKKAELVALLSCAETPASGKEKQLPNGDVADLVRGIGGVAGVLHAGTELGQQPAKADTVSMAGSVTGVLITEKEVPTDHKNPKAQYLAAKEQYLPIGIGGVAGYIGTESMLKKLENSAAVTGNAFVGGVVGTIHAKNAVLAGNVNGGKNTGLVLSSVAYNADGGETATREGQFVGGIAGYANNVVLAGCESSNGTASKYAYKGTAEDQARLKGNFVGGIAGFCENAQVLDGKTVKGGYVLGDTFVGGIVGGSANAGKSAVQSATVTVNGGHVVGKRYVGGIAGINGANSTLKDCVNNGLVAGMDSYVGGIVGSNDGSLVANGEQAGSAVIENCTSYIYDYNDALYNMLIKEWAARADYVGGIAGYNANGSITYAKAAEEIKLRDNVVSTLATGDNYVGGVVGYNEADGQVNVSFDIIGGKVNATGDCVGGFIGLNRAVQPLEEDVTVMPYSVVGRHFVGGIIGANIVEIADGGVIVAENLRALNGLATLEADGVAGGLIGYNRLVKPDAADLDPNDPTIDHAFVPRLSEANLLDERGGAGGVAVDSSAHMVLSDAKNKDSQVASATNLLQIRAHAYAGGLVGYNARGTKLLISNCRNEGSVRGAVAAGALGKGISVDGFLTAGNYTQEQLLGADNFTASFVGGIIGVNMRQTVLNNCVNTGDIQGKGAAGGIVGLNEGGVKNCSLNGNLGAPGQNVAGGIVGVNVGKAGESTAAFKIKLHGEKALLQVDAMPTGTLENCTTSAGNAVSGGGNVGGVAGVNLKQGTVKWTAQNAADACTAGANVLGTGSDVGGIVGQNRGTVSFSKWVPVKPLSVTAGKYAGGIAGRNCAGGTLAGAGTGANITVTATEFAGGLVGRLRDGLDADTGAKMTNNAAVLAYAGGAGGIVGELEMVGGTSNAHLNNAENYASVTANSGRAGGIVAYTPQGAVISNVDNYGSVKSGNGDVGGITALCDGTVDTATVKSVSKAVELRADSASAMGAVAARVGASGTISNCMVDGTEHGKVFLISSRAVVRGGVVGVNEGTVSNCAVSNMPMLNTTGVTKPLVLGGIAGQNIAVEANKGLINCTSNAQFVGFANCLYLGGVVGENLGPVKGCTYQDGVMTQTATQIALKGSAYGGIAGINGNVLPNTGVGNTAAVLESCKVYNLKAEMPGLYAATASQTSAEKAGAALSLGGVAGRNAIGASVSKCMLDGTGGRENIQITTNTIDSNRQYAALTSRIKTTNGGILGGIVGFNEGSIALSGYYRADDAKQIKNTVHLMTQDDTAQPDFGQPIASVEKLTALYMNKNNQYEISAEQRYSNGSEGAVFRSYDSDIIYKEDTAKEENLRFSVEQWGTGHAAGITGINAGTGTLSHCASGKWWVFNKSDDITATCGGVIGLNEAEGVLDYLLNQAYVFRETSTKQTDRFAGGIIGNQENRTNTAWRISSCVNFGKVYNLRSHYAGGIIGRWSYNGGTVEQCYNYGWMETTHQQGWKGAGAGIVACLHRPTSDQVFNILSCYNDGSMVRSRWGDNHEGAGSANIKPYNAYGANDSAGILGNITPYIKEQIVTINVVDCVNDKNANINSYSMASGIVCFLSADGSTDGNYAKNVKINIDRCRNYSSQLYGQTSGQMTSGMFGDRWGGPNMTFITNCFSITDSPIKNPITYSGSAGQVVENGTPVGSLEWLKRNCKDNYYTVNAKDGGIPSSFGLSNYQNLAYNTAIKNDDTKTYLTKNGNAQQLFFGRYQTKENKKTLKGFAAVHLEGNTNRYNANEYSLDREGEMYLYSKNETDAKAGILINAIPALTPSDKAMTAGDVNEAWVQNFYAIMLDIEPLSAVTEITTEGIRDADNSTGSEYTVMWKDANAPGKVMWYEMEVFGFTEDEALPDVFDDTTMQGREPIVTGLKYFEPKGIFTMPEGYKYFVVRVRATNNDFGKISAWAYSTQQEIVPRHTTPELRVELTKEGNNYPYKIGLTTEALQKNNDTKTNWTTKVTLDAATNVKLLTQGTPTQSFTGVGYKPLTALTTDLAADGKSVLRSSSQYAAQTFTPEKGNLSQNSKLKGTDGLKTTFAGTQIDTLTCTLTITDDIATSPTASPIYRAELLLTVDGQTRVVADADVLVQSKGAASVTFTGLDATILTAGKLAARCWYAQTGLGPVYTYHEIAPGETTTPNVIYADTTKPSLYSIVLAENAFRDFREEDDLSSIRPAYWQPPTLEQADGTKLTPIWSNNSLQYKFSWKAPTTDSGPKQYAVSLEGIQMQMDADGNPTEIRIPIDVGAAYTNPTATTFTMNADSWTYDAVCLTVTRLGQEKTPYAVGGSVTAAYPVSRRLPQIGQPTLTLCNPDDLFYDVTWTGVQDPEMANAVGSYELYMILDDGTTVLLGEPVPPAPDAGLTQSILKLDLEQYAGKAVNFYVIAKPKEGDTAYEPSPIGYKTPFTVPSRRKAPELGFITLAGAAVGEDIITNYVSALEFQTSKLDLLAGMKESIVGNYLYSAYFYPYDQKDAAQAALDLAKLDGTEPETEFHYGAGDDAPIGMSATTSPTPDDGLFYYNSMLQNLATENAGRWAIVRVRGKENAAISSKWTYTDTLLRLPGIKLDAPAPALQQMMLKLIGKSYFTPEFEGDEAELTKEDAAMRALEWAPVENAKGYKITLEHMETAELVSDKTVRKDIEIIMTVNPDGSVAQVSLTQDGISMPIADFAASEDPTDPDGKDEAWYDLTVLDPALLAPETDPEVLKAAEAARNYRLEGKYDLPDNSSRFYRFLRRPLLSANLVDDAEGIGNKVYRLQLPDTAKPLYIGEENAHSFTRGIRIQAVYDEANACFQESDVTEINFS